MVGTSKNQGVIPQALEKLYTLISDKDEEDIEIRVTYLEVYNEVLRDLLTSDDTALDIREDPNTGVTIKGASEIAATSKGEIMTMLKYVY